MSKSEEYFAELFDLIRTIPLGKVMSYGQAGYLSGYTPREVGRAMANCPHEDVPWHRVVGSDGYLRIGRRSPVHQALQKQLLESEGVQFKTNNSVDMEKSRYDDMPDTKEV